MNTLTEIVKTIASLKALAKETGDEYTRGCLEDAIGDLECARNGIALRAKVPADFVRHLA